jgi:putative OPT family oligopeptide transporter
LALFGDPVPSGGQSKQHRYNNLAHHPEHPTFRGAIAMAGPTPGDEVTTGFKPYIPDNANMREFTFQAVVLGTALGLIFAASSLYLVLKVGMTVSASIPVAVLAITLFRALSKAFGLRRATILENNIVQTSGSAGESIAFGVGVTMPALLLLGYSMDLPRIMVVSILGGILGILAMIPLRRAFIVKMHGRPGQPGTLLYPEGTACAQVLISGEKGGATGKTVFIGFGIAFLHKFITEGMALLKETVSVPFAFINRAAVFSQAMASELLGVGYIIGLRTSAVMMAGAVLGYLVIIPIIYFIGEYAPAAIPPGDKPIKEMSIGQIRNNYLLFIGAGCVATAGIVSMIKTMPMIVRGVAGSLRTVGAIDNGGARRRTENDMPMSVVLLGSLGLVGLLAVFLMTEVSVIAALAGALLVVLFGFLFVTVSARLTGEIGSSSNPISGMTTATLMLTCLIFLALGWQTSADRLLALSIAAVVCIASSNGGTTAQSLKTGFLVGGTPKAMQYAILIGALVSALVIGVTLIAFNESRAVISTKPENLPNFALTKGELDRLKESIVYEGTTYKVWHTKNDALLVADPQAGYSPRPEVQKFGERRAIYYVNPDTGKLEALKDNTIMGQLEERDDGSYVKREFEAPKTQVMGIVINGVLKGDLNWSMIGIGAMIALMLELCGVSALAFAVGVYVPIQFSSPIFLGGIVRYFVDRHLAKQAEAEAQANLEAAIAAAGDDPVARMRAEAEAKAQAEIDAIRKSETSGGVLLASGYIAGGSLAGVLLGFLAFSDDIPDDLRAWEHRTVQLATAQPLPQAAQEAARAQLGFTDRSLAASQDERVKKLTGEIIDLSKNEPYAWVTVPKGTVLKLPEGKGDFTVPSDMTLREVAAQQLGRERKAHKIFDKNADKLSLPAALPAGATLELPTQDWPAWAGFLLLAAFLLLVGMGLGLRSPPEEEARPPA